METIFAPASGSQRAGVAVIRVSGPQAAASWKALTNRAVPPPRMATYAVFFNSANKTALDRGLGIFFAGPASFTGEDVIEYHVHGGRAVVRAFLDALAHIPGCRLAEPGEFTRRAFENGKLDLTAAEAVADLIDAETEAQRVQALDQLGGSLETLYRGWAERLKTYLAHQEADIEFPDEGLPEKLSETLRPKVGALADEIRVHLDDRRGERLRDGIRVAILGAPNAGKSSLLNALAQRDAAIVSDEAGTTRDIIEVHLDLRGYPVILIDTAGLRETENRIEAEGVKRARRAALESDIRVLLFDGAEKAVDAETWALKNDEAILVVTKKDRPSSLHLAGALHLSAQTGEGLDQLLNTLTVRVESMFGARVASHALTRPRHRAHLSDALAALTRAQNAALPELAAEDLRLGLRALGALTGRVHVEELLDTVFRDFCIGK